MSTTLYGVDVLTITHTFSAPDGTTKQHALSYDPNEVRDSEGNEYSPEEFRFVVVASARDRLLKPIEFWTEDSVVIMPLSAHISMTVTATQPESAPLPPS